MKKIVIVSQQELDNLKRIEADQDVTVDFEGDITINNLLEVYGILRMNAKIICLNWIIGRGNSTVNVNGRGNSTVNVNGWGNSTVNVNGWGNSTVNVNGRGNSTVNVNGRENSTVNVNGRENSTVNVDGWENSTVNVNGWENSTVNVDGWGNSTVNVNGWGNSTVNVNGRENSTVNVDGWGNSTVNVDGWGNSTVNVDGWGNSTVNVDGRENSTVNVDGWENSTVNVNGWGNSTVNVNGRENSAIRLKRITCNLAVSIAAFCCVWKPRDLNVAIQKKTNTAVIIEYYDMPYLERNGGDVKDDKVILYKKVSKDWKTQENSGNETVWAPGTSLIHPDWHPSDEECGPGKFHACHRPVFCDEFRNYAGDRYVAISVPIADLYEWANPTYPHKIAFRTCEVLYECDRKGNPLK